MYNLVCFLCTKRVSILFAAVMLLYQYFLCKVARWLWFTLWSDIGFELPVILYRVLCFILLCSVCTRHLWHYTAWPECVYALYIYIDHQDTESEKSEDQRVPSRSRTPTPPPTEDINENQIKPSYEPPPVGMPPSPSGHCRNQSGLVIECMKDRKRWCKLFPFFSEYRLI